MTPEKGDGDGLSGPFETAMIFSLLNALSIASDDMSRGRRQKRESMSMGRMIFLQKYESSV